jgi:hypothetical protein
VLVPPYLGEHKADAAVSDGAENISCAFTSSQ